MEATGTNITIDPTYGRAYVSSANFANNTVTFSNTQTLNDGDEVRFAYASDIPTSSEYSPGTGQNTDMQLGHVQTSLDENNLKIEGYINIASIQSDAPVEIYIDDLVTVV